jgi:hypothetical protein
VAEADQGGDRKSRLHALEEIIADWLSLDLWWRTCASCGQEELMRPAARLCPTCRQQRQAEANRANQRRRRQREKVRRRLAAGHLKKAGPYFVVGAAVTCAHCGAPFRPARSSGRYCSPRCRVAAHRETRR